MSFARSAHRSRSAARPGCAGSPFDYPLSDAPADIDPTITSERLSNPNAPTRGRSAPTSVCWGKTNSILNATYYSSRTLQSGFSTPNISSTATYRHSLYVNAGRVDKQGVAVSAELNRRPRSREVVFSNLVYLLRATATKVVDMLDSYKLFGTATVISQDSMVMGGTNGRQDECCAKAGQIEADIYRQYAQDRRARRDLGKRPPRQQRPAPAKGTPWIYARQAGNPSYTLSWRNEYSTGKVSRWASCFKRPRRRRRVSLTQAAMD